MRNSLLEGRTNAWALSTRMAFVFTLLLVFGVILPARGQTFNVLYSFTNGADGGGPNGSLVQDQAGNLYGTTNQGGDQTCSGNPGCGTVFKLDKNGTLTTLYSFTGGSDGGVPYWGLTLSGTTLYGTTLFGGDTKACPQGCGVVFKVDANSGAETVLYAFTGGSDGWEPAAGVVEDRTGNLYGSTVNGGSSACDGYGCGVLFKLGAGTGEETVLHRFNNSDGANPLAILTLDPTGSVLYGTTPYGGSSGTGCGGYGCGVVFSLTHETGKYAVLHNFSGGSDGGDPWWSGLLLLGKGDILYGTTERGGNSGCGLIGSCGLVFKLVPNTRKGTVLYSFTGGADGGNPEGGVLLNKGGTLIGTSCFGGTNNVGTIFKLDPANGETVLHAFDTTDGSAPFGDLFEDAEGNFYGTTLYGGSDDYGVVFKITP
jgi:uncharacterized repeat protein (TIGR03803 family)